MIDLDVQADFKEVNKMLSDLETGLVTKAANSALNKTITSVQSVALKKISKDIGMTQKNVRKFMSKHKSTFKRLEAFIESNGIERVPLLLLGARQTKRGVTYVGKGGKRKLLKGAFIATMPKMRTDQYRRHSGVFKRTGNFSKKGFGRFAGKRRENIKERFGVSISYVMASSAVERAMREVAGKRWNKTFQHELNYRLRKYR